MVSVAGVLTVLWEIETTPRITQEMNNTLLASGPSAMAISPRDQGSFEQPTGTGFSQGSEKAGNLHPPSGTQFLAQDFLKLVMTETTCCTVLPYEGTKFLCRKERERKKSGRSKAHGLSGSLRPDLGL